MTSPAMAAIEIPIDQLQPGQIFALREPPAVALFRCRTVVTTTDTATVEHDVFGAIRVLRRHAGTPVTVRVPVGQIALFEGPVT